ncbi:YbaN family protein [Phenylobacterium sp.]|uniref:YbaN family protein n=1 Tax=Phenylobacterium sp. TaxID=1871053 RepID=UPI002ED81BFC
MSEPAANRRAHRIALLAYRGLGILAVGLAAAGAVLPVLPTTPFLLVALWAFARGAPGWADRLRAHHRFGPMIRDWEERGAIPRRAKVLAVFAMAASLGLLAATSSNVLVVGVVAAVLTGAAAFVVTRSSA